MRYMTNNALLAGADWRKSTRSKDGECVEIARVDGLVGVRDSKDQGGPVLAFEAGTFGAFLEDVKRGAFDH